MSKRCAQRSAHKVVQPILVQKLSEVYPLLETTALAKGCPKNPGGSTRCPAVCVWPLGVSLDDSHR